MTTKVVMPKPGMGTEDGAVLRWLKSVGEKVVQGEPLAEVEFAKATQEVEAPVSGTLTRTLVELEQTVPVNSAIAEIEEDRG